MSLLTIMDNIPLYSTIEEAEAWGQALGITGYHTHVFNGQIGYMSGYSHEDININLYLLNISLEDGENSVEPTIPPPQVQIETPIDIEETVEQTPVEQDTINVPQSTPTQTTTPTPPPTTGGGGGGY